MFDSDCKMCKKEVEENDKGVACEFCDNWFHIDCVGINDDVYKALNDVCLFWFCADCQAPSRDILKKHSSETIPSFAAIVTGKRSSVSMPVAPRARPSSSPTGKANASIRPAACNEWIIAKNKSFRSRPSSVPESIARPTVTNNRFNILGNIDENISCEFSLIGDSIVRDQVNIFCNKGRKTRRTFCVPGAKVADITKAVSAMPANKGTVIVNVGTNDIVLKSNGKETGPNINRNSVELLQSYEKLVMELEKRKSKSIIVGILPRLDANREVSSRILNINESVKQLCASKDLEFIDMWDHFSRFNRRSLYRYDGLHLSSRGSWEYGKVLEKRLQDLGF